MIKDYNRDYEKSRELIDKIPKSYCPAAFTEIYSGSDGIYRLCCHSRPSPELKEINKKRRVAPFEYFLSPEMDQIRDDMMSGKVRPECIKCMKLEEIGDISPRHLWLLKSGLQSDVEKVNLKLRIAGSFCNLGCYMCSPTNSSTRRKVLNEIYEDDNEMKNIFYFDHFTYKHNHWNEIFKDILNHIHLIDKIHMTGGEPLQLPKYWEFLESIPDEHAKNIKISHDTNLTKIRYKNQSIYNVIERFKHVFYGISADHYGEKLAWIRNPIDVKEFESNLKEIVSTKAGKKINVAISMLNIDDIFEIEEYYRNEFSIAINVENVVVTPIHLSICNLPQKMKDMYIEKYEKYPFIVAELKRDSHGLYEKGLQYCDDLSRNMGKDFRILWKDWLDKVESYSS